MIVEGLVRKNTSWLKEEEAPRSREKPPSERKEKKLVSLDGRREKVFHAGTPKSAGQKKRRRSAS